MGRALSLHSHIDYIESICSITFHVVVYQCQLRLSIYLQKKVNIENYLGENNLL